MGGGGGGSAGLGEGRGIAFWDICRQESLDAKERKRGCHEIRTCGLENNPLSETF